MYQHCEITLDEGIFSLEITLQDLLNISWQFTAGHTYAERPPCLIYVNSVHFPPPLHVSRALSPLLWGWDKSHTTQCWSVVWWLSSYHGLTAAGMMGVVTCGLQLIYNYIYKVSCRRDFQQLVTMCRDHKCSIPLNRHQQGRRRMAS